MPSTCIVVGCKSRGVKGGKSFFKLPKVITHQGCEAQEKSERRRRLWLAAINRSNLGKLDIIRICSDHFVTGKPHPWDETDPDWAPSKNLGYSPRGTSPSHSAQRHKRLQNRKERIKKTDTAKYSFSSNSRGNKLQTDNLMEDHYGKSKNLQNKMIHKVNKSSATVRIADKSPLQPSARKVRKRQINDQQLDDNRQIDIVPASQISAKSIQGNSRTTVKRHKSVAKTSQKKLSKTKPVEKTSPKQIFASADYQQCVMSNIASLWRNRKLCDARISNGSSSVMVHKIVLSAVSPKLLSIFSKNKPTHNFFEVNFPEEVSMQALNAFAEYMYSGLLDSDPDILHQLKIIAKLLDMKEFEQLCNSRLPCKISQSHISTSTVLGDLCNTQTKISFSPVKLLLSSSCIISLTSQSTPFITTQAFDVKQEPPEAESPLVKEDKATVVRQESEIGSLDGSRNDNSENFCMTPSVKIEPVGPEDDQYDYLNKDFDTSTVSDEAPTNIIHGITSTLKSNVFESSLVFDLPSLSYTVEKMCSQSSPIGEDPSKPLNQNITTQSIDNIVISGSNEGVYPVGLFTAEGDSLPLSSTQVTNVKNIGLYKTNDFT